MSTTEVIKESVQKFEHQTTKLRFQPGLPVMQQVQTILQRSNLEDALAVELPKRRAVRLLSGVVAAHCPVCFRFGFVDEVPV